MPDVPGALCLTFALGKNGYPFINRKRKSAPAIMKHRIFFLFLSLLLALSLTARAAAQTNDVTTQLKDVAAKIRAIRAKTVASKISEADLAPVFVELDSIYAQHKGGNAEDLARVLMLKATVYWSVVGNTEKGIALVRQIKQDYPNTSEGRDADSRISLIQQRGESRKILRTLTDGTRFPDFAEKDLQGNPLSVAKYKDKLVLVEFWATWCVPCVGELPNLIKAYNKHHADGFEIIGISLDKDEQKLRSFLKTKEIPWAQYCDGKGWDSKLVAKYGIQAIPTTFLLDGDG